MKLFFRESGDGAPVVILHGLFGSSDNWFTLAKKLSEKNKVYLLDLRNHGNSFHAEEFNYQVMAQDVLNFLEEHKIKQPVIIGHSMGGKVAMTIALNIPENLNKLIVADISPAEYPLRHDNIVEALREVDLEKVSSRQDAEKQLSVNISDIGVRQFLLKNLTRNKEGGYSWKLNLPVIDKNIDKVGEAMDAKKQFEKPTLFIKGENSRYIREQDHELISQLFPNYIFKEIKDAGHWVHAEQPEAFLKIVEDFIK
ncbi:alpha/beta fold hydrolase [soil metagenome]